MVYRQVEIVRTRNVSPVTDTLRRKHVGSKENKRELHGDDNRQKCSSRTGRSTVGDIVHREAVERWSGRWAIHASAAGRVAVAVAWG